MIFGTGGPRGSVLLRRGKTTPIYRLIRESCRENGAGDPCCGDCCRCSIRPSHAPVGRGGRQTRTDDRDRRGNRSGNRQIREGRANDGGATAGRRRFFAAENARRPPHPPARDYRPPALVLSSPPLLPCSLPCPCRERRAPPS